MIYRGDALVIYETFTSFNLVQASSLPKPSKSNINIWTSLHISGFKNIFNIIHLTKTHGKEGRVHGTATTHVYVVDQLVFYASSTQP